jgi:hypothetical protein
MYYVITGAHADAELSPDSKKWLNNRFSGLKRKKSIFSNKYYVTV